MRRNISLKKIIKEYNLCIRNNPYGTMRSWPNSYVELFYENFCNKLYQRKKSPNILEIDQTNDINLKLWEILFDNPKIDNYKEKNLKSINYKNHKTYDLIIIKNKHLINDYDINSKLISLLKLDGIIVYENIGRKTKYIIKLYLRYLFKLNIEIFDYRLNSFILNNCLLIISKKRNFNILFFSKRTFLFLKFLIIEIFISTILKLYKILI